MRIITLALLVCSALLAADDAGKDAKIDQLLKLLHADQIQDQIYTQLGQQIDRATLGLAQQAGIPAAEQRSATADLQAKMNAAMKESLNWEKLKPVVVQAYRDNFTDGELDAILAFYKSPSGSAYLSKAPLISAKSRDTAEAKVRELGVTFNAMGKEWADQHPRPAAPAK